MNRKFESSGVKIWNFPQNLTRPNFWLISDPNWQGRGSGEVKDKNLSLKQYEVEIYEEILESE